MIRCLFSGHFIPNNSYTRLWDQGSYFCAVYNFNVENVESSLNETKASFLPDHTVLWQVGDEITFQIRLYDDASDEQIALYGGNQKVWEKEINGKLSYTDAGWKTYEDKIQRRSANDFCQSARELRLA